MHKEVAEVCCVGVPNEEWGEEIKAVINLEPGADQNEVLKEFCAVEASAYIAALCALIPSSSSREEAVMSALELIDKDSEAHEAVQIGIKNKNKPASKLHDHYGDMSPVHSHD